MFLSKWIILFLSYLIQNCSNELIGKYNENFINILISKEPITISKKSVLNIFNDEEVDKIKLLKEYMKYKKSILDIKIYSKVINSVMELHMENKLTDPLLCEYIKTLI